jgi:hypothetical protein
MTLAERLHVIGEQIGDVTRGLWSFSAVTGIRRWADPFGGGLKFWDTTHPPQEGTEVNYDVTRSLYRNDGENAFGAGFAKPIVDLPVSFMGIPTVSTENEELTRFLNSCLTDYWVDEIQQMFRDAIRDSRAIVRLNRPDVLDPLMTLQEARYCRIELIAPERVDIERRASNKNIIERALIRHRMVIVKNDGNPAEGRDPETEQIDVLEIIDRERYRFFDQTHDEWMDNLGRPNPWGFVPILEVFNEWDTALQGGQSDLETVIPFINAFHDVLAQGLQAHKYHSTPKVKLKLADVAAFVKSNFPTVWDETTGTIKQGATVSWKGNEIFFMQQDDDMGFVEAQSVLGDTKTLAEFLIDCICIASETPEWAFMRVDSGSANSDRNAQTVPWIKKIDRKRRMFAKPVQELCKMVEVANGLIPFRPTISWETVRADDQVVIMQAFQQLVMGLEVARERGEISDETYQNMIRKFLPVMGSNSSEFSEPVAPPALPPPSQPQIRSGA